MLESQLRQAQKMEAIGTLASPYLHLKVSDTGCGTPHHQLEWIFEPYFTIKAQGYRTVGLSVVHGIITTLASLSRSTASRARESPSTSTSPNTFRSKGQMRQW